ncbi:probable uridine nucleosidase 2 [Arthrobacter sp. Hiyo8]|nr:probable uridine nucleosidase 2 [Arthrobacter sp. Hiyo8]
MTTTTPQPFYLDCDTGIDDSLAIAYLLASPEVELAGIGTVSGNVSAATGAVNTLNLLHAAGRAGIPVAVGAHDPLMGRSTAGRRTFTARTASADHLGRRRTDGGIRDCRGDAGAARQRVSG